MPLDGAERKRKQPERLQPNMKRARDSSYYEDAASASSSTSQAATTTPIITSKRAMTIADFGTIKGIIGISDGAHEQLKRICSEIDLNSWGTIVSQKLTGRAKTESKNDILSYTINERQYWAILTLIEFGAHVTIEHLHAAIKKKAKTQDLSSIQTALIKQGINIDDGSKEDDDTSLEDSSEKTKTTTTTTTTMTVAATVMTRTVHTKSSSSSGGITFKQLQEYAQATKEASNQYKTELLQLCKLTRDFALLIDSYLRELVSKEHYKKILVDELIIYRNKFSPRELNKHHMAYWKETRHDSYKKYIELNDPRLSQEQITFRLLHSFYHSITSTTLTEQQDINFVDYLHSSIFYGTELQRDRVQLDEQQLHLALEAKKRQASEMHLLFIDVALDNYLTSCRMAENFETRIKSILSQIKEIYKDSNPYDTIWNNLCNAIYSAHKKLHPNDSAEQAWEYFKSRCPKVYSEALEHNEVNSQTEQMLTKTLNILMIYSKTKQNNKSILPGYETFRSKVEGSSVILRVDDYSLPNAGKISRLKSTLYG